MTKNEILGSGDDSFKAVMLSKKGKKILEQIISQVLGKTVEIIEFINTELGKTQKIEKRKRVDVIVKMDGIIANVEVNTNDYIYTKYFRNFVYLVALFNRYSVIEVNDGKKKKKKYDYQTNIIQVNLNFGVTDIKTDKLILENRFGNVEGHIIKNLVSYDVFIDNIKKFCYDNGSREEYKYLLMLDMTLDELEDFYPDDEIIKEYGDALMKYSEDVFIYPHSEEEEKQMMHDMEIDMAYDDGVDAGIEQTKIEMIKNFYKIGTPIEDIAKASNLSVEKVKEIIDTKS